MYESHCGHFEVKGTESDSLCTPVGRIIVKIRACSTYCARGSVRSLCSYGDRDKTHFVDLLPEREPFRPSVRAPLWPQAGVRNERGRRRLERVSERASEALPKIWACIRETKTHLCGKETEGRKNKSPPSVLKSKRSMGIRGPGP